jgi:hypothetical protein
MPASTLRSVRVRLSIPSETPVRQRDRLFDGKQLSRFCSPWRRCGSLLSLAAAAVVLINPQATRGLRALVPPRLMSGTRPT